MVPLLPIATHVLFADVLDVSIRERSSVVGGGGGGLTIKGTGLTFPHRIRTHHQKFVDVWVRLQDGREDKLDLSDIDLPVRATQQLALLTTGQSIWAIRNFTSNQIKWLVTPQSLAGPYYKAGFGVFLGYWFLIYFVVAMATRLWITSSNFTISNDLVDQIAQNWNGFAVLLALATCPVFLSFRSIHKNRGKPEMIARYSTVLNSAHRQLAEAVNDRSKWFIR